MYSKYKIYGIINKKMGDDNVKKRMFLSLIIVTFVILLVGCDKNTNNNTNNMNNTNSNINTNNYIKEEKAKQIALDDANLKENEVSELSTELDYNDEDNNGNAIYEVSFKHGQQEFDYDIDANTGIILNKNVEIDD